jgi:hypothetical protein
MALLPRKIDDSLAGSKTSEAVLILSSPLLEQQAVAEDRFKLQEVAADMMT